jgi:hypothetical protein
MSSRFFMALSALLTLMEGGSHAFDIRDGWHGNSATYSWPSSGLDYFIIVNQGNPVKELSREKVAAYFLKRLASWPNGATVVPVDLPPDSPARGEFSRKILLKSTSAVSAYWIQEIFAGRSEPPEVKNSEAAVISYVAATPGAIGYVTTLPSVPTVRAIKLQQ